MSKPGERSTGTILRPVLQRLMLLRDSLGLNAPHKETSKENIQI